MFLFHTQSARERSGLSNPFVAVSSCASLLPINIADEDTQANLRAMLSQQYDDCEYLLDETRWLAECDHPKLEDTHKEVLRKVHAEELKETDPKTMDKRFTQRLLKTRCNSSNVEANRLLKVLLFASVVRAVIVHRYHEHCKAHGAPPKPLDREPFIVDADYHMRGMTANELLWLPRYHRAMSVADELLEAKSKKQLFLDCCAYLEGSYVADLGRPIEYITGSKASDPTRRRVRVFETVTFVLPEKRPERQAEALRRKAEVEKTERGEEEVVEEEEEQEEEKEVLRREKERESEERECEMERKTKKRERKDKAETKNDKEKEKEREEPKRGRPRKAPRPVEDENEREREDGERPFGSQDTLCIAAAQVRPVPLTIQHSLSAAQFLPRPPAQSSSRAYNAVDTDTERDEDSLSGMPSHMESFSYLLKEVSSQNDFQLPPPFVAPAHTQAAVLVRTDSCAENDADLVALLCGSQGSMDLSRQFSMSSQTLDDLALAAEALESQDM